MFKGGPRQLQNRDKASGNTRCQKCLQLGHHTYQCTGSRPYVPRPSQSKQLAMGSMKGSKSFEPSIVTPDEFKSSSASSASMTSGKGLADKILQAKEKERERFKAEQAKKDSARGKDKKRSPSLTDSDSDSASSGNDTDSDSSTSSRRRRRPVKPVHRRTSPRQHRRSRSASDSRSDSIGQSASPPPKQRRRRYSTSPPSSPDDRLREISRRED